MAASPCKANCQNSESDFDGWPLTRLKALQKARKNSITVTWMLELEEYLEVLLEVNFWILLCDMSRLVHDSEPT